MRGNNAQTKMHQSKFDEVTYNALDAQNVQMPSNVNGPFGRGTSFEITDISAMHTNAVDCLSGKFKSKTLCGFSSNLQK